MLAHKLHPAPSADLLKAITFHDSAERWVGDVPAPSKWWIVPEMRMTLDTAEERILRGLEVLVQLSREDQGWLKALDLLELYLFCLSEQQLGNRNVDSVATVCRQILREGWIPQEVHNWMEIMAWERTEDGYCGVNPEE